MPEPEGLRERKKRKTRAEISEVATRLFVERGFDSVTVAEVARAAGVSKMTVFNYFPLKEDLFFDRNEEGRELVRGTIAGRAKGESPIRALRRLADELLERRHPFAKFTAGVAVFWRTVENSAALRARAREMRDELERDLAGWLAEAAGQDRRDPTARLVAASLVSTWAIAYAEALRRHRAGEPIATVHRIFESLLDRGFTMVQSGMKGTPYQ